MKLLRFRLLYFRGVNDQFTGMQQVFFPFSFFPKLVSLTQSDSFRYCEKTVIMENHQKREDMGLNEDHTATDSPGVFPQTYLMIKVFMLTWHSFCLCQIIVNAQNGRRKQLFAINCDTVNIYLLFPLPQKSSRLTLVQEADSAVFLDIPQKYKNMTDNNNNRFVWSDEEREVFPDLIHRK